MNLRIIGFGGILGIIVVLFSQLILISWSGEAIFNEPNKVILIGELFLLIIFMSFTSFLLVEEIKSDKIIQKTRN